MDGKNNQILDPKLKEAYDRVMGASVPAPTPKPVTPPPPADMPVHTITPTATVQTPTIADSTPHVTEHPHVAFSSAYVAPTEKHGGKSSIPTPLLIVAGIVFFVIYTLFCMKAFGMPIPFLG